MWEPSGPSYLPDDLCKHKSDLVSPSVTMSRRIETHQPCVSIPAACTVSASLRPHIDELLGLSPCTPFSCHTLCHPSCHACSYNAGLQDHLLLEAFWVPHIPRGASVPLLCFLRSLVHPSVIDGRDAVPPTLWFRVAAHGGTSREAVL